MKIPMGQLADHFAAFLIDISDSLSSMLMIVVIKSKIKIVINAIFTSVNKIIEEDVEALDQENKPDASSFLFHGSTAGN